MLTHFLGSWLFIDVANLKTFVYHAKRTPDINQVYLVEIVYYLLKLLIRISLLSSITHRLTLFFFLINKLFHFKTQKKKIQLTLQQVHNTKLELRKQNTPSHIQTTC
jgi:hypothetical protein